MPLHPGIDTADKQGTRDRVDGLSRIIADVADSNAALWREKAALKKDHERLVERFAALVSAHEALATRFEELVARERQGPLFRRHSSGAPPTRESKL